MQFDTMSAISVYSLLSKIGEQPCIDRQTSRSQRQKRQLHIPFVKLKDSLNQEKTMPKGKGYGGAKTGSKMPSKGGRTGTTTSGGKKK